MTGKIIGAMLIIGGCGAFGYAIAASYRKEAAALRQMISALDFMQCELQYRLTPLPDLCAMAGKEQKGIVGQFLKELSLELENQISPNVSCCVNAVLAKSDRIPGRLLKALELLGASLGRFDAEGQLKGLEHVRSFCREEVDKMADQQDVRLRSYQTLGLCAGAALAILFV